MQKCLGKIQMFLGFSTFIERQLTHKPFSNKNVKILNLNYKKLEFNSVNALI